MNKNYTSCICFVTLMMIGTSVNAQAFRKGALLVSISEGKTLGAYSTSHIINNPEGVIKQTEYMPADRDPIIIEYALTNHFGIGLSSGNDIYKVSPSMYGFKTENNDPLKVTTAEVTIDFSYHPYVNKRLDLSVFGSSGLFSTSFKGGESDYTYKYASTGGIIRVGTRARYYFWKRLGAFGMVSSAWATSSPDSEKTYTIAKDYSTSVNAFTVEVGLTYRFLRK